MRIIVDNNQVSPLCHAIRHDEDIFRETVLVLSLYACAEILLAPKGREKLRTLSRRTLRFGEEVATVLNDVAVRTDAQALSYDPVLHRNSRAHRLLRSAFRNPSREMKDYAERIKQVNRDHQENLSNGIRLVSKKNRDAQSRGEQIDLLKNLKSIKDAMAALDVSKTICSVIPNIDKGDLYASSLRLMSNPHTRRFLLFTFTLHLGYGDAWLNSALNVSASGNRDDLSDMALSLYARKGDIILTEDKMFQRIHKHIDLQQHIQIMTCEKCIEYLKSTR